MLFRSCRPKTELHNPEGMGAFHKSFKSAIKTSDKSQKLQVSTHGDSLGQVDRQPDKGGKNVWEELNNYRPILLLNTESKIFGWDMGESFANFCRGFHWI